MFTDLLNCLLLIDLLRVFAENDELQVRKPLDGIHGSTVLSLFEALFEKVKDWIGLLIEKDFQVLNRVDIQI